MIFRKFSLTAGTALLLLAAAPASAQIEIEADPAEWEKVVEAAKQEGKVVFYAANAPDLMERLVTGFEELYPEMDVEFLHITGANAIAKIDEERAGNLDGADVMLNSALAWWKEQTDNDRLLPFGPSAVGWPEEFVAYGVPLMNLEPFGIVYNTQLMTTPPTGYEDLLKPEYRGKIATSPPVGTNTTIIYDFLRKQIGEDFLDRLKEIEPRFYEGGDANAQAVASGEVWATMWGDRSGIRPLLAAGAPLDFVLPKPATSSQTFVGAFAWSKRPNAARLFVDYVLSHEGQTDLHSGDQISASPRFDDIPDSLSNDGLVLTDTTEYTPERIREIREEFLTFFRE